MGKRGEVFWLDDDDPKSLRRRAADLQADGLWEAARMLMERAEKLEKRAGNG